MASSAADVPGHDRAIRELTRGRELTRQLRVLLRQIPSDDLSCEPAGDLSLEVQRSLTAALRILEPSGEDVSSPHCSQARGRRRSNPQGQMLQSDKKKQHSWTHLTATPYHDGHQWRKYGQKQITGASFYRSYYRCTYSDVGCKATKQVQRAEGEMEPHMFVVKYNDEHTCRSRVVGPPAGLYPLEVERSTRGRLQKQTMVSFGANPARCKEGPLLSFFSSFSDQPMNGAPDCVLPSNHCSSPESSVSLHHPTATLNPPLDPVLQASLSGSDCGGSFCIPTSTPPAFVSGGGLDGFWSCDCSFELDLDYV